MLNKHGVTIVDFGELAALSDCAAFGREVQNSWRLTSSVGYRSRKSIKHRSWPIHRSGRCACVAMTKKATKPPLIMRSVEPVC
jgi:hypothetical protein